MFDHMTDKERFFYLVFLSSFLLFVGVTIYEMPVKKTEKIVRVESRALAENADTPVAKDAWGNELRYNVNKDDNHAIYTVVSSGRDELFGTRDDIQFTSYHFINPAKMVGKWSGNQFREFGSGFIEGFKNEEE